MSRLHAARRCPNALVQSVSVLVTLGIAGCSSNGDYAHAVCALVDTSGTYADQRGGVVGILKQGVLPKLQPGDSLIVVRIDGDSYGQENVEATVTLDPRPSHANAQKLRFAASLDRLETQRGRSRHTDITGGMMLCGEYLAETGAGTRTILVFSDMKEELPPGAQRALDPQEFAGTRVIAMNVKKLRSDNRNPARFRARLDRWRQTVTDSGAVDWQVIHDPERLVAYLADRP